MSGPLPKRWQKPKIVELVAGHADQAYIDGLDEFETVDLNQWRKGDAKGISVADFHAYMPMHS